jgi:hypothetical protein
MRILYIGSDDIFSRHELGFIATLSALGKVELIHLGTSVKVSRLKIGSDNGEWHVSYKQIPYNNVVRLNICRNLLKGLIEVDEYDMVISTPRIPSIIARLLLHGEVPIVLRLWSIRAAKVVNDLQLGCYQDLLIYLPSIIANLFYISGSTYAMALGNVTYVFARRTYPLLAHMLTKVYPLYSYIVAKNSEATSIPKDARFCISKVIERGDYMLGFTVLSKRGVCLRAGGNRVIIQ